MSTISSNDVMIGDFYLISIVYKDVEYTDLFCKIMSISSDAVDVLVFGLPDEKVKARVLTSNLEHIPITAEFLEKNGLSYDKDNQEWNSRYNKYRKVALFAEIMDDPKDQFWMIEAKSVSLSATFWCKSVDDLQHLLKLAGANFTVKP